MILRRRFLLSPSLARLIERERGGLRQTEGFFPPQRDHASWVRLEENRAFLVLQSVESDGHREEPTEIPVAHAHALLDACSGEIDYSRTLLALEDTTALIDQVTRPRLLRLVTVEFDTEDQARRFRPKEWFGPEVTNDPRYANQSLALKGLDQTPEIPLTDGALNSLIDALDGRFPARGAIPINRPAARQVPATRAKTQANADVIRVDIADLERAMMQDRETSSQKSRSK